VDSFQGVHAENPGNPGFCLLFTLVTTAQQASNSQPKTSMETTHGPEQRGEKTIKL